MLTLRAKERVQVGPRVPLGLGAAAVLCMPLRHGPRDGVAVAKGETVLEDLFPVPHPRVASGAVAVAATVTPGSLAGSLAHAPWP